MLKTAFKLLWTALILVAVQACAAPTPATPDPNVIDTAIAGTFAAAQTQTAGPGIPITGPETLTPTATIAASLTPVPTLTPVVLGSRISVSVATNCRIGPGTVYPRIGALLVGESAEVVGRSADGRYWIIRNPDRPNELCWLWGEHATLTGVPSLLPVYTPPPTPIPSPTITPSRTFTPAPTSTFTPTSAPTFTPSPTPSSTPTPTP